VGWGVGGRVVGGVVVGGDVVGGVGDVGGGDVGGDVVGGGVGGLYVCVNSIFGTLFPLWLDVTDTAVFRLPPATNTSIVYESLL